MEFLERIGSDYLFETWYVRIDGAIATARVFELDNFDANDRIAQSTARWLGFRHSRVTSVLSVSPITPRLVIATGDERGPSITHAAKQLTYTGIDERGREAWAVHEIIALADALSAMAVHERTRTTMSAGSGPYRGHHVGSSSSFVHRRANPEQIFIGGDGHARFRAPIEQVHIGPIPNYLGRGPVITGFVWMSPELVRGTPLTPASDVFQLATTLFTLLTGERLAHGNGDFETLRSIIDRTEPPQFRTSVPGLLEIVQRALALAPDARYRDPMSFADALRALPVGPPPAAAFDIAGRQPHPPPSRSAPIIATTRCKRTWAELAATTTDGIRFCDSCRQDVVRVSSTLALVPLLGKRCVSLETDDN